MVDRPIIFSAPMVRALLAGRKTQTRRLATGLRWIGTGVGESRREQVPAPSPWLKARPGDRLWVREAWRIEGCGSRVSADACRPFQHKRVGGVGRAIEYRADGYAPDRSMERSPIHMPRWASRLTLTVTDVRVQRLQEISEEDAIAEGIQEYPPDGWHSGPRTDPAYVRFVGKSPRHGFEWLWADIHGPDAWEANPEVVALTFTVTRRNIDQEAP